MGADLATLECADLAFGAEVSEVGATLATLGFDGLGFGTEASAPMLAALLVCGLDAFGALPGCV